MTIDFHYVATVVKLKSKLKVLDLGYTPTNFSLALNDFIAITV